jgi:opacity protein-like surface antigen
MKLKITLLAILITLACAATAAAQANQSMYTNLDGRQCRTLESDTSGAGYYRGQCPGVAGYKLQVEEGDIRQNITIITPRGKKHSLDLWSVVGSSFSFVGKKAEWRVQRRGGKITPVALIVRYNLSNAEDSTKQGISYLTVSKITADKICVTHKISPSANANEEARQAADNAANQPCLESGQ